MRRVLTIPLPKERDTIEVATKMADCITQSSLVTFQGDIGAGKTTFIRAMLKAKGIKSAIKSPTFSLVESYTLQNLQIHHFDLYRIHNEEELELIGFRDYFTNDAICCIEWPEHGPSYIEKKDIECILTTLGEGRELTLIANTPEGKQSISCLEASL
jgi:tRNA threonylcarbamoyladenosine biosynthesis protein TsaE